MEEGKDKPHPQNWEEHLLSNICSPYMLSKVFVKLVAKQMTAICEMESAFKGTISGFCRGQSTSTVLLNMGFQDDMIRAMKSGEVTF